MICNSRIIKKTISFGIVAVILFFLFRILFDNWQKIREYEFSFNYFYVFLSLIFLSLGLVLIGATWNIILRKLGYYDLGWWPAIKITVAANFGKYIPGKIWGIAGAVYLARKNKIPNKILTFSYLFQTAIGVLAALFWGCLLTIIHLGANFYFLYYFLFALIPIFIIILCPKILFNLINFLFKKIKQRELNLPKYLKESEILLVSLLLSLTRFLHGSGFFLLIKSFWDVSWNNLLIFIGVYVLANVSGYLALFAPAGLGVKEGILVLLLKFYLPLEVAIFVSFLARIWLAIGDILVGIGVWAIDKVRKI